MATNTMMAAPARIPVEEMMERATAWEREAYGEASRDEWNEKRAIPREAPDVRDGAGTEEFGDSFYTGLVDSLFADVGGLDEIDALLRIPSHKVTDAAEAKCAAETKSETPPAAAPGAPAAGGCVATQPRAAAADPSEAETEAESGASEASEDEGAWAWDIKLEPYGRNGFRAVRVRVPAGSTVADRPTPKAAPLVVVAVPAGRTQPRPALNVAVPAAAAVRDVRAASPTSVMMIELSPAAKLRRSAALVRWRAKRKRRKFGRVVYKRRKVIANARPRRGGRFVKTSNTRWVSAAQL